jgi:hypothetical protein
MTSYSAFSVPSLSAFTTPEFQGSLAFICKGSDQAMIYGWRQCGFDKIGMAINSEASDPESGCPFKRSFNWTVGDPKISEGCLDEVTTVEGRKMNLIPYEPTDSPQKNIDRMCKTALTDIVLENYKRQQEGLPLIPIVFCIDITDNPRPTSIQKIASKEDGFNKVTTHKELRRALKLCTYPSEKILDIALQTFKFVKVCTKDDSATLEQVPAPWAAFVESLDKISPAFAVCWDARKTLSASEPKSETYNWRQQLEKQIAEYDRARAQATEPPKQLN